MPNQRKGPKKRKQTQISQDDLIVQKQLKNNDNKSTEEHAQNSNFSDEVVEGIDHIHGDSDKTKKSKAEIPAKAVDAKKTDETNETPVSKFDKFIRELEELNGEQIEDHMKHLLIQAGIKDISTFCDVNLDDLITVMEKKPESFRYCGKIFKLSYGDKLILKKLIIKSNEKKKQPAKKLYNFDKNRKPKLIHVNSTLENLIEAKCYIDKTEPIQKMIELGGNRLITRPRRFGKSLVLETINAICHGDKELFKDCHIGQPNSNYDWRKKYPVINLNFSVIIDADPNVTNENLKDCLKDIAEEYNVQINYEYHSTTIFTQLINELSELKEYAGQVVILIDEYDYYFSLLPKEKIEELAEDTNSSFSLIKDLFTACKALYNLIKLTLRTGVLVMAYRGETSGDNTCEIESLEPQYDKLYGFTEDEILKNLGFAIDDFIEKSKKQKEPISTTQEFINKIRENYNGYRFSFKSDTKVYNPVSVMKCLYQYKIEDYWIQTGSPSVLEGLPIDEISLQKCSDNTTYSDTELKTVVYELNKEKKTAILLYQTGYLTIVKTDDSECCQLKYPNNEVRSAMSRLFARKIYDNIPQEELNNFYECVDLMKENQLVPVFEKMNLSLGHGLGSNKLLTRNDDITILEAIYNHSCYLLFNGCPNVNAQCQVPTGHGKLDLTLDIMNDRSGKLEKKVIFEMKVVATNSKYSGDDHKFAEEIKKQESDVYGQIKSKCYDLTDKVSKSILVSLVFYDKLIVYFKSYKKPVDKSTPEYEVVQESFLTSNGRNSNTKLEQLKK